MRIVFAALAVLAALALVLLGTGLLDGESAQLAQDAPGGDATLDLGGSLGKEAARDVLDARLQRSGVEGPAARPEEVAAGEAVLGGRVVDRLRRVGLSAVRVASTRRHPLVDRLAGFRVEDGLLRVLGLEFPEGVSSGVDEGTFAVSREDGVYRFSRRRDGSYVFVDDPYWFARAAPRRLLEGVEPTLEVELGGRIVGTIEVGGTQEGPVVVQLLSEGGGGFGRGRRGMAFGGEPQDLTLYTRGTHADATGTFEFRGVPSDARGYRLRVAAPGLGTRLSESFAVRAGQDTRLEVVVPRGIDVVGQVTAAAGGPVPNALVEVFYEGDVREGGGGGGRGGLDGGFPFGGLPSEPFAIVRGDADGRFRVGGMSDGRYRLGVQAEGFVRNDRGRLDVQLGGHAPLTVTLEPAVEIRGVVRRAGGGPVADALVRAVTEPFGGRGPGARFGRGFGGMAASPALETRSDAQGRFALDGFDGEERLQLEAVGPDGWMGLTSVGREDDRSNVVITLEPTGSIALQLVHPPGVAPAAEVRVELTPAEEFVATRTETFLRPNPQGIAIERVAAGAYRVDVRGEGFVRARAEVEVVADQPASLVVAMSVGTAVRGIALEAGSGRPVVGAEISVATDFSALREGGGLPANTGLSTRSDAAGHFALEHLAPGVLALVATHADYPEFRSGDLDVPVDRDLVGVQVLFTPGGTIQGSVLDDEGLPREGVVVRAEAADGEDGGPGRGRGGFGGPGGTRTDAAGRYAIENLRPGAYRVGLTEGGGGGRGGRGGRGGFELERVRTVVLQPGQILTVDFHEDPAGRATLVGTVLDGGRRASGGTARLILASGGRPATTRIAEDGTFRFERVVLGVHQVQIDVADGERNGRGGRGRGFGGFTMGGARFAVELLEAKSVERTFVLPAGVIAGTVRDAQGSSERLRVRLLHQEGSAWDEVANASVEDGRFVFDHLEAGAYRVIAESTARFGRGRRGNDEEGRSSGGAPAAAFVQLTEGQRHDGVALVLIAPAALAYGVEDESGEPVRNARVVLDGADEATRDLRGFGGTNAEGRGTIDDLAPGLYRVTVSHGDLGTVSGGTVKVVAGGSVERTYRLTPGAALRVTLKDESGEPVEDATLEVWDANGFLMASYPQRGGAFFGGSSGRPADGVYGLGKLPPGSYRIDVTFSPTRRRQSFSWRHAEGRAPEFTVTTRAAEGGR